MKKISKTALNLILAISIAGCSVIDPYLEKEDFTDQSKVDFLVGVKESGVLKKETHFTSSDDYDVKSDIQFIYEKGLLIKKIFTDYNWESPLVIQKDTFMYNNEKLSGAVHYEMKEVPSNRLDILKISNYFHPDGSTKIRVDLNDNGTISDSVIYKYSGNLIVQEKHCCSSKPWGYNYEYTPEGKLA